MEDNSNNTKIDSQEVDFIATKADEKKYIQVTESMNAPETRERELAPLRKTDRFNTYKLFSAYKPHCLYAEKVHSRLIFFGGSVGYFHARTEMTQLDQRRTERKRLNIVSA